MHSFPLKHNFSLQYAVIICFVFVSSFPRNRGWVQVIVTHLGPRTSYVTWKRLTNYRWNEKCVSYRNWRIFSPPLKREKFWERKKERKNILIFIFLSYIWLRKGTEKPVSSTPLALSISPGIQGTFITWCPVSAMYHTVSGEHQIKDPFF